MKYYLLLTAAALIGYLLGSINTAVILSKLLYKKAGERQCGNDQHAAGLRKKGGAFYLSG